MEQIQRCVFGHDGLIGTTHLTKSTKPHNQYNVWCGFGQNQHRNESGWVGLCGLRIKPSWAQ